ncbi:hypothetical protein ABZP36_026016 [Zizania latifolia]
MTLLFDEPPAKITGHRAHPEHELEMVATAGTFFRCDGCQEPGGAGRWYRCEPCDFDLHIFCARPPATLQHTLFTGSTFKFLDKPPQPEDGRKCDACGERVGGFVFHCEKKDLDLHPCCASLKERIVHEGVVFELRKETSHRWCSCCQNRCREFWFFRCRFNGEDLYIHLTCLKKEARDRWESTCRRLSGADQIVHAGAPMIKSALQSMSNKTRRSSGFKHFGEIAHFVGRTVISVLLGNPMPVFEAVAGPIIDGLLQG